MFDGSLPHGQLLFTQDDLHRGFDLLVGETGRGLEEPECIQHTFVPIMCIQWL